MRKSSVLTKIKRNQPALATTLHLADPRLFELAAIMGFDAIWLDLEHHPLSLQAAESLIRAARVGRGSDIIARPAKGEFMRMSRMLEAGATGIMYPRCDNISEAREVVRWAKFAPLGQRGFDGSGIDAAYTLTPMRQYLTEANEQTFVLIQLEEPDALRQAEGIAALPGVDMIMLGPADFSVLTGIPGQFDHPTIQSAIQTVATAAKNAGKHWAHTCSSIEQARKLFNMGCRLVFLGADIIFVRNGFEQLLKSFSTEFGVQFTAESPGGSAYLEKI
jgi:4-hydroxy-2-oxoheptanedioate aldolase